MADPLPPPPPASPTASPGRARWSRRRKVATWTSVGFVASALGLVVLDRGAELVVERMVAGKVQDCLGTPERPDVEIGGFPLLPELVRGRLGSMTLTARDANAQGVRVQELHVEARGVERQGAGGTMDSLRGSGLVTYEAMEARAMGLTVSYGGDGQIKVSGGLGLLSGSATATASIVDGDLILKPGQISTGLFGELDLGSLPEISFPIRELPTGVDVELNATERGLEFTFDGTDVTMPGEPCKVA